MRLKLDLTLKVQKHRHVEKGGPEVIIYPITTHCHILTHFGYIAVENIVRKGEIAFKKQSLLFSQCFLPYMALIFHFRCTLKCRLQFV